MLNSNVPSHVSEATTRRYFVDLESIGTDNLRLYIDGLYPLLNRNSISFKYDANLNLIEKKIYKRGMGYVNR